MRYPLPACLGTLLLAGCVSTELETPAEHPANPQAASRAPRENVAAALDPEFEPFEHYPERGSAPQPGGGHAGHGAPPPAPTPRDGGADAGGGMHPPGHGAAPGTAPAEQFTCVMHPEVLRSAPGRCPKCGMKLVPKKERGK